MFNTKDWYKSRGVWGGIVAVLAAIMLWGFKVNLSDIEQGQIVDALVALGSAVGGAVAVYGRVKATHTIGKTTATPDSESGANQP